MFTDTDRGQVGIGTLIVFIAMVLVAAIAAGVLINTAGLLQSQAEATGEESSEQVTDRVQVDSVVGTADSGGDEIEGIDVNIRRGAGSGDINVDEITIDAFAAGSSDILVEGDGFETDGDTVLSDTSDRATLEIVFGGSNDLSALDPGEVVSLQIVTAAGGSTFVEKRAPSTLDDDEEVRL